MIRGGGGDDGRRASEDTRDEMHDYIDRYGFGISKPV